MGSRGKRRIVALAAVALVAAACGSSKTEQSSPASTATASSSSGPGATSASSTTAPARTFGTLASPCGPGDAKGATATGVTDTAITIGSGDDAGYIGAPGLNKEIGDGIRAIVGWCNDQGGINGRKVKLNTYDAKLLDVKTAITQACNDKVFMLVGEGWALDNGQEDLRIGCKIAAVPAFSVSAAFAHGPAMAQPVPNPSDQTTIEYAYALAERYPAAVKKVGYVYADYSATLETMEKAKAATPAAGFVDLKCDQIYNVTGEQDWKPFAEKLKSCGVDFVYWVGNPAPNLENLLVAARQIGFNPQVVFADANHYDAGLAEWNGAAGAGAGDNLYVTLAIVPFEEASSNPATRQYLDLLSAAKGRTGLLGVQAVSAFLLWATGVQACGSNVTQKCVLGEIAKQTAWTGGGLHVPTNPGANEARTCAMLVRLKGGKFERFEPASGFHCDTRFRAVDLRTKYVTEAKLVDRVATQFGTFTAQG